MSNLRNNNNNKRKSLMIRQHNLKLYHSVALVHENNHVTLLM